MENITKGITSFALTFLSVWQGLDVAIQVLILMMILDWGTGLAKAYLTKTLSSAKGAKGLWKKGLILTILAVSCLLDYLLGNETPLFRTLTAFFYITNEALSITENCHVLGLPLPAFLVKALEQIRENSDNGKNGGENYGN